MYLGADVGVSILDRVTVGVSRPRTVPVDLHGKADGRMFSDVSMFCREGTYPNLCKSSGVGIPVVGAVR